MNQCDVCDCDFDIEAEGGIDGYFGILPVSFCPTCYACMCDMADQASFREWIELTDDEVDEIVMDTPYPLSRDDVRAIEAKLKDRNT